MNVCILGLGYVGVPLACIVSNSGHTVVGVDIQKDIVDGLNQSRLHITEPGVAHLLSAALEKGTFRATTQPVPAEVFMICVPTPVEEGHRPDLRCVRDAVRSLLPVLKPGDLVIIESTLPVGATAYLETLMDREGPGLEDHAIHTAYCPERVLPGNAIHEMIHNHRMIGGTTSQATDRAIRFYRSFTHGNLVGTSAALAEMAKLAENTYRDVNIAFANELSLFCRESGIDPFEVIQLANMHPRVNIHTPGVGVGGHCIPVDPWFLVSGFPDQALMTRMAREVNLRQENWVVQQVIEASERNQPDQVVVAGLTYKPDVDDFRESPALRIANRLSLKLSRPLIGVDPHIEKLQREYSVGFPLRSDIPLDSRSLIVILVSHRQFEHFLNQAKLLPSLTLMNFTDRGANQR